MAKRILSIFVLFVFMFGASFAKAESVPEQDGVDIMIICAHPGDEFLFLGGVLPKYVGDQGRSAVIYYLSSESEAQRKQANASLLRYGDRVRTIFGSFSYAYTGTEEEAKNYWDIRELTSNIVGAIREYKPNIVLTHDQKGEYGHGAHCLTFDAVYAAAALAAETGRYPDSEEKFGVWKAQRVFSHLYGENLIALDRSVPLANAGGMTALALDQQCYGLYEKTYPIEITDESGYTCAKYGLIFPKDDPTLDVTAGDLFAGLDVSSLYPTAAPTATPTAAPTPTPTAAPEAASQVETQTASNQTSDNAPAAATEQRLGRLFMPFIVSGALALASFAAALFIVKSKWARLVCVLIGCLFAISIAFLRNAAETDKMCDATNASDVFDTPTPTKAPTPTPTKAPTPTPEPHPWEEYFRSATDPAEVVINDPMNEHWEYRTDKLSILIDRVHTSRADGKPICYCIADIRMRDEDAFQAGVRNENPKAQPGLEQAWHMARRYRAVLGIAGDNLLHSEADLKGILMRNGIVYSVNQAQDILAMIPQDLTMRIYKPQTISAQELLDMGVKDTFSFGPTLLNNGVRDTSSKRGNLGKENPRSGIGMVEPGHFIVITADGRQRFHSWGLQMCEFAHLFYVNGCKVAYNLDGGSTAVMIFMGECLNQHSGEGSDVQRPMTDGLFWGYSELVPTVDDPVYNDGSKPWVMPPNVN